MSKFLSTNEKTVRLVETSVLLTLTVLLYFLSIPISFLKLVLAPIPVMIGAVLLGPKVGLLLGTAFGLSSFVSCFITDPFGALLLAENPFFAFLTCVPTRMMMGFLTGLLSRYLTKKWKPLYSDIPAAFAAPILNTIFFMSVLMLCYYQGATLQGMAGEHGIVSVFDMVVFLAGINAVVEAIVCSVAGYALLMALRRALRR